jgi:hypothetical protein
MLQSLRTHVKDLPINMSFKVIKPEVSTLVFDGDSCVYPHKVLGKR